MRENENFRPQGGDGYLLGIQLLAAAAIGGWTLVMSSFFLVFINCTIGLRMSEEHERLGADLVEHDIGDIIFDKSTGSILTHGAGKRGAGLGRGLCGSFRAFSVFSGVGECLESLGRNTLFSLNNMASGAESSNFKHNVRRLSAVANGQLYGRF